MVEPLIPIKKPDGTFVKVTMAEFKAMQQKKTLPQQPAQTPAPTPVQPIVATQVNAPAVQAPNKPVQSVPSHPVQIKTHVDHNNQSKTQPTVHHAHVSKKDQPVHHKPLTSADARSPLEEKMPVKNTGPLTSGKREQQVEEVVRELGFGVSTDLLGRLKSLVLARLKDIKTDDDIRSVLLRPTKNGGIGLSQPQAEKVISSIQEVYKKQQAASRAEHAEVPVLKGKQNMSLMVEPPELPAVAQDVAPKSYAQTYAAAKPQPKPSLVPADDIVSKLVKESMAAEPVFKISNKAAPKQFIQDVTMPQTEMGPVEELKSITLADFRRLSTNPEEAAARLQQKLLNLQAESFVWYLDGLSAYHNSPLYLEYIQSVCQSLAERKSLANVLMMKNSIKLSEALAIIEMEKSL